MEEILKRVSEKTGVPVEVIRQVQHDLWRDVKRLTYQPHNMLASVILGNVLKMTVRYKMVKRLSYQYANSDYNKFRKLAAYYKTLATTIEQTKYTKPHCKTPERLERLYEKKFNITLKKEV
jgi:hypothetical protein